MARNFQSPLAQIVHFAQERPDAPAIVAPGERLTFRELLERACALAIRIESTAEVRGRTVAVCTNDCVELVVGAIASWLGGGSYLPLDPSEPELRLRSMLSAAEPAAIVANAANACQVRHIGCPLVVCDEANGAGSRRLEKRQEFPQAGDIAYVIFTSGSTGMPKGVAVTHGNLSNLLAWHRAAFQVQQGDRGSQFATLTFDAAVLEIWPMLCVGATLYVADAWLASRPSQLADFLVQNRINVCFAVTPVAEQLMEQEWPQNTALRYLLTGADILRMRPRPGLPFQVINNYGPTECTVLATSGVVAPAVPPYSAPGIGRAIPGAEVYILNERLETVPDGEAGQICLGGDCVSAGYAGRPNLTAERFISYPPASNGPIYLTGDRGRKLENGEFEFLGRIDDQIKLRGYRIEPGEIVAALRTHPAIQAADVICTGSDGSRRLTAYIVQRRDGSDVEIASYLFTRLPSYMVPEVIVRLDSLPLLPSGKVNRCALPVPAACDSANAIQISSEDTGSLEDELLSIVKGLIGRDDVGVADNFFRLGGHSLLAAQLLTRIRSSFGVELSLRSIFGSPTVTALAEEIESRIIQLCVAEGNTQFPGQASSLA